MIMPPVFLSIIVCFNKCRAVFVFWYKYGLFKDDSRSADIEVRMYIFTLLVVHN